MKAAILHQFGSDAPFTVEETKQPTAGKGHVVVRIAATSVNTVDTMIRSMGPEELPLSPQAPAILGMDFAGTIEEVGDGVTGFSVGDEVYGCAGGLADLAGALAEFMAADARLIALKPKSLSMREAAALPLVGITALEGLERAGVRTGQRVLVQGGAGGVGHVAVQLAKRMGAQVYTTISGAASRAIVAEYGATAINYREESVEDYVAAHTGGAGFDVVYDSVGGANLTKSFEAAALNAQVVTTVSMLELDLTPAHFKGLSIHVVFMLIPMLHDHAREEHARILRDLASFVDEGALKPLVDEERFGLETVADAYAKLSSGKATGKIVIEL
ncbi:MAG: zinc-dependent alcohol dehydrogenase family protein [Pseudomonadota bacterium]